MSLHPKIIVGAIVLNKDKIFLGKSKKWSDMWTIPGGHVEFGENLETALKREIKEETNLDISNIKFISYSEYITQEKHYIFFNFSCECINTDVLVNEEFSEYRWFSKDELIDLPILDSVKEVIAKI